MQQKILVLDLGSRLTQRIARAVRTAGVYAEIHPIQTAVEALEEANDTVSGIILSGNDAFGDGAEAATLPAEIFQRKVPVLGIAAGMHALARHFGAAIRPVAAQPPDMDDRPWVVTEVRARGHTRLLADIQDRSNAAGHGLLDAALDISAQLASLPNGFIRMASTPDCDLAGIANESQRLYGLQFHPEVSETPQGQAIVHRFVHDICGCDGDWSMAAYADQAVADIRKRVGSAQVVLGLSGGVDSSVAAALIHRAIGQQLVCVFVDHGLLRLNEAEQVMNMMQPLGVNIVHVDASASFMQHLEGEADPEAKRKIIGREFIEVFQAHAAKLPDVEWLAQGTIYPDVIESAVSASGGDVAVKSHHNVGGLPDSLNLKLLEPLRYLFKDEVRELGMELGLPAEMVERHPFPGPGLGVRILGAVNQQYADTLRQADAIFIEALRATHVPDDSGQTWYEATSQAFAVFLPVKSVGVTDAGRRYAHVIALRAVQTTDFMSAAWAPLPADLLERISTRIIKEVDGVSRVVYDISGKPPATIEWE